MCKGITRYDVAKRYAQVLRECETAGLNIHDWISVSLVDDVQRLRRDGLKMRYCIDYVGDKYAMSTARVWRILRSMKTKI